MKDDHYQYDVYNDINTIRNNLRRLDEMSMSASSTVRLRWSSSGSEVNTPHERADVHTLLTSLDSVRRRREKADGVHVRTD